MYWTRGPILNPEGEPHQNRQTIAYNRVPQPSVWQDQGRVKQAQEGKMRGTLGRWTVQITTKPLVFYICIMLPGRPRNQLPPRKPKGPPTPLRFPRVDKRVGPSRGSLGQGKKPNSNLRGQKSHKGIH